MENKKYCYEYPRPALTVDVILFAYIDTNLSTLLIQRKDDPFKDCWAYPGGFVDPDEVGEMAALRELKEETNIEGLALEELFTDSNLDRDPRGRTVSIVYCAFSRQEEINMKAGDDAKKVAWFSVKEMPELAFDHDLLFQKSLKYLNDLLSFKVFGKDLLPVAFSLDEIKNLYLQINSDLDFVQRAIHRIKEFSIIKENVRSENTWSFNSKEYHEALKKGFL